MKNDDYDDGGRCDECWGSETISFIFIKVIKYDDGDDDGDIDGGGGGDDDDCEDVNIFFAGMNQLQQQRALSATTRYFLKLFIILAMLDHRSKPLWKSLVWLILSFNQICWLMNVEYFSYMFCFDKYWIFCFDRCWIFVKYLALGNVGYLWDI